MMTFEQRLREIARTDGRFAPDALLFLHEGLGYTVHLLKKQNAEEDSDRHVTGKELYKGLETLAKRQFGPLAAQVWRSWGIKEPFNWGEVVFLLVNTKVLRSQPDDKIDDFRIEADFDKVFVQSYEVPQPDELV